MWECKERKYKQREHVWECKEKQHKQREDALDFSPSQPGTQASSADVGTRLAP